MHGARVAQGDDAGDGGVPVNHHERLRWRLEQAIAAADGYRATIGGYASALVEQEFSHQGRIYVETVKACAEVMLEAEEAKTRILRVALDQPATTAPTH